jgi:flagellar biogenesis protein FliO
MASLVGGLWFSGGLCALAESPAATNYVALPGELPGAGASVLRVFGALVLVTAIFLGGVWLFRNWQRFAVRKGGAPRLNVIEVKSLGQRHALYVVGYDQQRMLLASSPAGVTLVSHLPAAEEGEAAAPVPQASFAEAFRQILQGKT